MDRWRAAGALLALTACIASSVAAPTITNDNTALDLVDEHAEGCYYNFQHYGEGDRIMTNEPCLNCTCHNRMLMCYLRVCPFTKAIGQDCTVEKRADQCCPIVTCPDVPVDLLTSTSTTLPTEYGGTGVGKVDNYGCTINGRYFPEGSKVPQTPGKPCEHCYCIRNMTTCVMQECTLHVDGCTPIYHKDVCCPVRYFCDHPEDEMPLLDDMTTTVRPTPGFLLTTTEPPATEAPTTTTPARRDCIEGDQLYPDGALIKTEKPCEHCYCMKGDIVCVVQECGTPMENEGKNCTSMPPREGQCCPDTYICEGDEISPDPATETPFEYLSTTTPPRRVSVEGSGYRNEDEIPYTAAPTFATELEGSGEEEPELKPIHGGDQFKPEVTAQTVDDKFTTDEVEFMPKSTQMPILEEAEKEYPELELSHTTVMSGVPQDESTQSVLQEKTTEPSVAQQEEGEKITEYPIISELSPITEKESPLDQAGHVKETTARDEQNITEPSVTKDQDTEGPTLKPESGVEGSGFEGTTHTEEPEVTELPTVSEKSTVTNEEKDEERTEPPVTATTMTEVHESGIPFEDTRRKTQDTEAAIIPTEVTTSRISEEKSHAMESTTIKEGLGFTEPAPINEQNTVPIDIEEEIHTEHPVFEKTTTRDESTATTVPSIGEKEGTYSTSIQEDISEHEDITTPENEIKVTELPVVVEEEPSNVGTEKEQALTTEPVFRKEDKFAGPVESTTFKDTKKVDESPVESVTPGYETSSPESETKTEEIKPTTSGTTEEQKTESAVPIIQVQEDEVKRTTLEQIQPTTTESIMELSTFAHIDDKEPVTSTRPESGIGFTPEKTEQAETTTINPEDNEIAEAPSPGRIPGEGDCLLEGITYKNDSMVPSINKCHTGCRCVSSIIKCDPILCSPAPEYMDNCQPMYDTPESCCPTYICDHGKETIPPQSHSQMSGTESPTPSPSAECNGDQCEVVDVKQPSELPTIIPDRAGVSDCGNEGCSAGTQTPIAQQPEYASSCADDICSEPTEGCADKKCEPSVPPTRDQFEVPVKDVSITCEGDSCEIKPDVTSSQGTPELCTNEEDCKQVQIPQTSVPICEGDLCFTKDCISGNCKITPTQTSQQEDCTAGSGCQEETVTSKPISPEISTKSPAGESEQQPLSPDTEPPTKEVEEEKEPSISEKVTEATPTESHDVPQVQSEEKTTSAPIDETDKITEGSEPAVTDIYEFSTEQPKQPERESESPKQPEEGVQTTKPQYIPSDGEHLGTLAPDVILDEKLTEAPTAEENVTDVPVIDEKASEAPVTEYTATTASATEKASETEIKASEASTQEENITESSILPTEEKTTDAPVQNVEAETPDISRTGQPESSTEEIITESPTPQEKSTTTPITEQKVTDSPVTGEKETEEKATEYPEVSVTVEKATEAPEVSITEQKDTEAPESPVIEEKVTKAPEAPVTEERSTEAPEVLVTEEETNKLSESTTTEEKATEAPEVPFIVEKATEAPEVYATEEKITEVPEVVIAEEKETESPEALVTEKITETPEILILTEKATESPDIKEKETESPTTEEKTTKTPKMPTSEEKATETTIVEEQETEPPVTEVKATKAPIEEEKTTKVPALDDEGTKSPVGEETATQVTSTEERATVAPIGEDKATELSTTEEKVTKAPATEEKATESPITEELDTEEKATEAPVSEEKATEIPATEEMATETSVPEQKGTEAPTTEEKDIDVPESEEKVTEAPVTEVKASETPATEEKATVASVPEEKATQIPATEEKATEAPVPDEKVTEIPETDEKATEAPVSDEKTTKPPPTEEKVTKAPTTEEEATTAFISEEKATDAPVTQEKTTEAPATEEKVTEEPVTDDKATEVPLTEEKATETPVTEEKATETPVSKGKATEAPVPEEKTTERPATQEKATKAPVPEEKGTETPTTEEKGTEVSVSEEKATEAPVTAEKATETPATEERATVAPVPEVKATEIPAIEEKITEAPVLEEKGTEVPVTEEKATEAPITEVKASETPVTEEKATVAPVPEEKATEIPATQEKATEAPVTVEKSTETPKSEEKGTEEPVTQEKATDEPVTEEKTTETPATEEKTTGIPATEEKATELPVPEEKATEAPLTEEKVTLAPAIEEKPEDKATEGPTLEEKITEKDVAEEKVTEQPSLQKTTDVPVTEEKYTKTPVEAEATEVPALITEVPASEEKETEISTLVTEIPTTEEKASETPALVTEEPVTEERATQTPVLVTEVPALKEKVTDASALVTDEIATEPPASITDVPAIIEKETGAPGITVEEKIPEVSEFITEIPIKEKTEAPVITVGEKETETPEIPSETVSEVPEAVTEEQSSDEKATKAPAVIFETKATETYVQQEIITELPETGEPKVTESVEVTTTGPIKHVLPEHDDETRTEETPITKIPVIPSEDGQFMEASPETPISQDKEKESSQTTTPYLVELEEHTHKIDDELSSMVPSEVPTTARAEEPTEIVPTEMAQSEAPADEEKKEESRPTELPTEDVTDKTIMPAAPQEETTSQSPSDSTLIDKYGSESGQDKDKAPSTQQTIEEEGTPAPTVETGKPLEEFPDLSDKEVTVKPHDVPVETTAPEEEFIPVTEKVTTSKAEEEPTTSPATLLDKFTKPEEPLSEISSPAPEAPKPDELHPTDDMLPPEDDSHFPPTGGYNQEPDYMEEDQAFGPGTCRYGGKVYVSAQQIPRDDPCDFCFCFRSDIICLQQSCPPPIHGCHEEPIQGFCCPRYECPVSMATTLNITTTTTTTTTTLPPHFLPHAYKGAAQRRGCQIKGHTYKVGEVVRASSGPCLHCTCGGDGQMKCDPKACTPEPMLRQMIAAAVSAKRRR